MKKFSVLLTMVVAAAILFTGCKKKDEGQPAGEGQGTTEPAKTDEAAKDPAAQPGGEAKPADPAAGEAKPADPAAGEAKPADPAAGEAKPADPAAGDPAAAAPAAVDKETLGKAYEEIYCAQKKGETDKIMDIYKKYGFTDPKAWTEAWSKASEDTTWFQDITKKVQEACP